MTIFEEAARYALSVRYEDISEEMLLRIERAIVDTAAVCIAAVPEADSKRITDYVMSENAKAEALILGTDCMTSMHYACLVNGTNGHLLDYDDNGLNVGHPSSVICPALFAAAQVMGSSGREVVTAYYAAFQVANCMNSPYERKIWFNTWHMTPVVGIFGTVIAAGLLLGLDQKSLTMALGIASSQCSGFQSNYGTPTKGYHVGAAAAKAMEAVLLAKRGFTSSPAAAEGPGWIRAYTGVEYDEATMRPVFDVEHGVPARPPQIKPYPCCGGVHSMMESAYALAQKYDINHEQVEKIVVEVDRGVPLMAQNHRPENSCEARFSSEFACAAPIVLRSLKYDIFSQQAVDDERIKRLCAKVSVEVNEELNLKPAGHPSYLNIYMKDGTVYKTFNPMPKGNAANPLTDDEFNRKIRECTETVLKKDKVERLIDNYKKLHEYEHFSDFVELMRA